MTHRSERQPARPASREEPAIQIRHAKKDDLGPAVDLTVRMKRLNNEFDPIFAVVAEAKANAENYLRATVDAPDKLLLLAVEGTKVVGVLRAEMRERIFYEPHQEGFISDFYILPEYRRRALGHEMLQQASAELREMGAQIIVADVPAQNGIANRFYVKRGFRVLTKHFALVPQ